MSSFDSSDDISSAIKATGSVTAAGLIIALLIKSGIESGAFAETSDSISASGSRGSTPNGEALYFTTALPLMIAFFSTTENISGDSQTGPDAITFIRNDQKSKIVEERARKIYDMIDKNHELDIAGGASLLAETAEVGEAINEIIGEKSPQQLYEELEVVRRSLTR